MPSGESGRRGYYLRRSTLVRGYAIVRAACGVLFQAGVYSLDQDSLLLRCHPHACQRALGNSVYGGKMPPSSRYKLFTPTCLGHALEATVAVLQSHLRCPSN
jgi:hypothetical protein